MKVIRRTGSVEEAAAIALGRDAYCNDCELPPDAAIAAQLELIVCGTNDAYGREVWNEGRAKALAFFERERPGSRPGPYYLFDVPDGEWPFMYHGELVLRDNQIQRHLTQPQWLHRRGLLTPSEMRRLNPMAYELGRVPLRIVATEKEDDHE
jgi:hypothetical protein